MTSSRCTRVAPLALALALGLATSTPARAATCSVPSGAHPTITDAVNDLSCDPIEIAAGTYFEENIGIGRNLTLQGAGASVTTIDAGGLNRVLNINDVIDSPLAVTIRDLAIQNGRLSSGAGITVQSGPISLTLERCRILNNEADFGNAGVSMNDNEASLTIRDSLFAGNVADGGSGGGLGFGNGIGVITNTTFSGNLASDDGGAIRLFNGGDLTLNNVTLTGNVADSDDDGTGEGGGIGQTSSSSILTLSNVLLAGNLDLGSEAPDCGGPDGFVATSLGYNLVGVGDDCTGFGPTDLVGTAAAPLLPVLGPLQDNGGSTETHALLAASPALDAGNPAPVDSGAGTCESLDQRGVVRPQGAQCDVGAFEREPSALHEIPTTGPAGLAVLALALLLVSWALLRR